MKTKKIVTIGILAALSIVFGYLERFIPLPVAFPGVKIGLSNICVIVALYKLDIKSAFAISMIKAFVCGVLFWGAAGLIYGLAGAILSFVVMALLFKFKAFDVIGVSIAGAVAHNLGQLIALLLVSGSFSFIYYMAVLGISGIVMGVIIGVLSKIILSRIKF